MSEPVDLVLELEQLVLHKLLLHGDPNVTCELSSSSLEVLAQLAVVASVSHNNLRNKCFSTQRDLYYLNTALFSSASRVSTVVDELRQMISSQLIGLPSTTVCREDLGIAASGKCIIAGNIRFRVSTEEKDLDVSRFGQTGFVIATEIGLFAHHFSFPHERPFVLVVEKEATARFLLDSDRLLDISPNCVLLCAKGYPCVASRNFMRRLYADHPSLPFYALVDGDHHGVRILLTYIFGDIPIAKSRAPARLRYPWTVLPIKWIGLRPSQLSGILLEAASHGLASLSREEVAHVTHTSSALKKALDSPAIAADAAAKSTLGDVCLELDEMARVGLKAELQTLQLQNQNGLPSPLLDLVLTAARSLPLFTTHSQ